MNLELEKFHGRELAPNIYAIGEPTPVVGTNKLTCLAECNGALILVELVLKFGGESK